MMTGSDANFDSIADARFVRVAAHRLDDVGDRAVDVEREALDRRGPRDVAQVVEHALERLHLAIDGARERLAVLGIVEDAHDQLAAVADVLHRMREIVHEAGRHAAEHRLPLLLSHVLGELDELVGHAVEGVAQLPEFVFRGNRDALVEAPCGDGVRAAHEREDRLDERAPEEVADADGDEQREADDEDQLAREADRPPHRLRCAAARP